MGSDGKRMLIARRTKYSPVAKMAQFNFVLKRKIIAHSADQPRHPDQIGDGGQQAIKSIHLVWTLPQHLLSH
jgi:hypothetical protein